MTSGDEYARQGERVQARFRRSSRGRLVRSAIEANPSPARPAADDPEAWGGVGFDPRAGRSHHYAFHVSEAEVDAIFSRFDAIFSRVKRKGILYGSEPYSHGDGQLNTRQGGRGFYFEDPYGHLLEVMTVPETGS